ncbi:lytic transglycosylase domain-containing protein [Diaphorobacter sp. J5-51]|uniref:lytic transglycosylase domain-containing protein n=1 Tax=Diaphorobacter sp. J5-51 TaxID=680496 RepID=UPI000642D200|nr:lytic transglycosylase domain-containing protein [Diaphorobacter sp. J5-51]KLR58980.1 lytic transglycosylase [Diaphorobacter sp. J5-51]
MRNWVLALTVALPIAASATCFDEAAKRYGVPPALLKAISTVESGGNPNARNVNKNGSYDIGHMQINSSWLPTLAKFNIDEKALGDACVNTNVGAWVLAHNIARYGLSWEAVGAYNAASPSKRLIYAQKVADALRKQANARSQARARQEVHASAASNQSQH